MPLLTEVLPKQLSQKATGEQERYVNSILNNVLTITDSISGSGKTTLAVAVAKYLNDTEDKPLYYFFAPVGEKIFGFTPGDLEEKESKYLIPLKDALIKLNQLPEKAIFSKKKAQKDEPEEFVPTETFKKGKKQKLSKEQLDVQRKAKQEEIAEPWVHATSHAYWRGGNIENATIIIDEAQNWTKHELKKVLTRIHDNCKVILIGHQKQCDIDQKASGFPAYIAAAQEAPFGVGITPLTKDFRGKLARWADKVE